MKFVYLLLVLVSAIHSSVDAIYKGSYLPITEVPYQAQLNIQRTDVPYMICGAAIISEYWVASAAHCVASNTTVSVRIRLGTSSTLAEGIVFNTTDIIVHSNYSTEPVVGIPFDICLVKSAKKFEFNQYLYPIPLSRVSPKTGDELTVSGYGFSHYGMFYSTLRVTRLHVIDDDKCVRKNHTLGGTTFCTDIKEADLCHGDSGSPAVLDDELVGIASDGCEYNAPVVFVKVAEFYNWIVNATGIKYD